MSPHGLAEFGFTETRRGESYGRVSAEYYDETRHPTCADFRDACRWFIGEKFQKLELTGRIADIGCGKSLLAEFHPKDLVLVDASDEMLNKNGSTFEKRKADILIDQFGNAEFDWVFAVLGDPYNARSGWKNIQKALTKSGRCVFMIPAFDWAQKFRGRSPQERPGFARFDLKDGSCVFLPSLIYSRQDQTKLVEDSGLKIDEATHVLARDLKKIRSRKISDYLSESDPIVDVYCLSQ